MKIIFGLGNPGKKYIFSRHNAGFIVLDYLAELYSLRFKNSSIYKANIARINIKGQEVIMVKPLTFMNNSGQCIKKVIFGYGLDIANIIVVYDDVDLALGKIRFRISGGSAGHQGMFSIIEYLSTEVISRLRIGVGRPENNGELINYVLSSFTAQEKVVLKDVLSRAVNFCKDWVDKDSRFLMQEYN